MNINKLQCHRIIILPFVPVLCVMIKAACTDQYGWLVHVFQCTGSQTKYFNKHAAAMRRKEFNETIQMSSGCVIPGTSLRWLCCSVARTNRMKIAKGKTWMSIWWDRKNQSKWSLELCQFVGWWKRVSEKKRRTGTQTNRWNHRHHSGTNFFFFFWSFFGQRWVQTRTQRTSTQSKKEKQIWTEKKL